MENTDSLGSVLKKLAEEHGESIIESYMGLKGLDEEEFNEEKEKTEESFKENSHYFLLSSAPPYYIVFREEGNADIALGKIPKMTLSPLERLDLVMNFCEVAQGYAKISFSTFEGVVFYKGIAVFSRPTVIEEGLVGKSESGSTEKGHCNSSVDYFTFKSDNEYCVLHKGKVIFARMGVMLLGEPMVPKSGLSSIKWFKNYINHYDDDVENETYILVDGMRIPSRIQNLIESYMILRGKGRFVYTGLHQEYFQKEVLNVNASFRQFYLSTECLSRNLIKRVFYFHPGRTKLEEFCVEYRKFIRLLLHATERTETCFLYGLSTDVLVYNIIPHFPEFEIFCLCHPICNEFSKYLKVKSFSLPQLFSKTKPLDYFYNRNLKILKKKEQILYLTRYFRSVRKSSVDNPNMELLELLVNIQLKDIHKVFDEGRVIDPFLEILRNTSKSTEDKETSDSMDSWDKVKSFYTQLVYKNIGIALYHLLSDLFVRHKLYRKKSQKDVEEYDNMRGSVKLEIVGHVERITLKRRTRMDGENRISFFQNMDLLENHRLNPNDYDVGLSSETMEKFIIFLNNFIKQDGIQFHKYSKGEEDSIVSYMLQFVRKEVLYSRLSDAFVIFAGNYIDFISLEWHDSFEKNGNPSIVMENLKHLLEIMSIRWENHDYESSSHIFRYQVLDSIAYLNKVQVCNELLAEMVLGKKRAEEVVDGKKKKKEEEEFVFQVFDFENGEGDNDLKKEEEEEEKEEKQEENKEEAHEDDIFHF